MAEKSKELNEPAKAEDEAAESGQEVTAADKVGDRTLGRPKASDPPQPPSDQKFPVDQLVAESQGFLGYATFVAAGGLYGQTKDLSVTDAKAKIEEWLSAPLTEEA